MGADFNDYLPVLITIVLAVGLAGFLLLLSVFIGKKAKGNPTKDTPYECGRSSSTNRSPRGRRAPPTD